MIAPSTVTALLPHELISAAPAPSKGPSGWGWQCHLLQILDVSTGTAYGWWQCYARGWLNAKSSKI